MSLPVIFHGTSWYLYPLCMHFAVSQFLMDAVVYSFDREIQCSRWYKIVICQFFKIGFSTHLAFTFVFVMCWAIRDDCHHGCPCDHFQTAPFFGMLYCHYAITWGTCFAHQNCILLCTSSQDQVSNVTGITHQLMPWIVPFVACYPCHKCDLLPKI
jgi:hypothetical protein